MRMRLRGELCIGAASVLSFISLLLLIFVHVAQINTSNVPRKLYMAELNVSGYGRALEFALKNPIYGLYTNNASAPLALEAGLRQTYRFGLYSRCAYINETAGNCNDHTTGQQFQPLLAISSDVPNNYSFISRNFLDSVKFNGFGNSKYTGQSTKAAYWMILLGTVCAALALLTGILKNNYTFLISTLFSVAGSFLLLIGASIWTVVVKRTEDVNGRTLVSDVTGGTELLGITMTLGPALSLLWGAFGALLLSVIPYMISCCTWRG
ncbi:hypothetical protein D9611_005817 [Ephemerocybe angulata]|uniref:Actin cortical patch SUR7/pH-response regulator pali n=2 Tax=Ephemerocybe angulata TaxID=980116 RepID=A0A8H6ILG7_9AGAR|nr:hypothetical protein D9611_005817 [Tulosesus angulatus]KAF6766501.1 actin cortical patch SUR7/pH-response regulator pali [Tulosesus angulatus]